MRATILPICFLSAFAVLAQAPPGTADRAADREAIRKHIDGIFNAYIQKDRETVRATHSADWRGFLTGSRNIIRGIDEYMAEADYSLKNPNGSMTAYHMVDYDISFHGDVAIINYIADVEGKQGDQTWKGKLRVLDVYEKHKGEWIQIASNTAQHPEVIEKRIEDARKSGSKQ
jgi:ketosteroid isomerase-like protein